MGRYTQGRISDYTQNFINIDVLCDGPFIKELKDPKLHWVGSSNQNVIDIPKRISQVRKIIR